MTTATLPASPEKLATTLAQYYGSDKLYRSRIGNIRYTTGMKCFFELGGANGAYWLRDIILTEPKIEKALREYGFLCIVVDVTFSGYKRHCTIRVCDDLIAKNPDDPKSLKVPHGITHYVRAVPHTDLQLGQWIFYLENNVLMLPGER